MPTGLVRYQNNGDLHFVNFSCASRRPLLQEPGAYEVVETVLERARSRHGIRLYGYVLMPEHLHLLLSEPKAEPLSTFIKGLKQETSRQLKGSRLHFWMARFYDFNVFSKEKFDEKLKYLHRNPVARGLVQKPAEWQWSSFNHYLTGVQGTVEIESWWTEMARKRVTGLTPGSVAE